jgi:hypothetical protein
MWLARDGADVKGFTGAASMKWYSSNLFSTAPSRMEADMLGDGDDAGHCSNGASGWNYRAASAADRATFRRWIRSVIAFYVGVLMLAGAVALMSHNDVGLTQLADVHAPATAAPLGQGNSSDAATPLPAAANSAR